MSSFASKSTSNTRSTFSSNRVGRAISFFKTNLKDNSIKSTTKLGKEVYNIKDKVSNRDLGYLGFLVNLEKLDSLSSYILNLGLKYNNSNFIILIYYALDNSYYYYKIINKVVSYSEHISSSRDLSLEFRKFKLYLLNY